VDEIIEQLGELIAECSEVLERETPLAVEHGGKGLSDAE
jgi:hypothetical protein